MARVLVFDVIETLIDLRVLDSTFEHVPEFARHGRGFLALGRVGLGLIDEQRNQE